MLKGISKKVKETTHAKEQGELAGQANTINTQWEKSYKELQDNLQVLSSEQQKPFADKLQKLDASYKKDHESFLENLEKRVDTNQAGAFAEYMQTSLNGLYNLLNEVKEARGGNHPSLKMSL